MAVFVNRDGKKRKGKANTKSHLAKKTGKAERDKEQRRVESDARVAAWQKLSLSQQIESLDLRDFVAKKQRAKIAIKLAKEVKG